MAKGAVKGNFGDRLYQRMVDEPYSCGGFQSIENLVQLYRQALADTFRGRPVRFACIRTTRSTR